VADGSVSGVGGGSVDCAAPVPTEWPQPDSTMASSSADSVDGLVVVRVLTGRT
jgi:hypothetical protein